MPRPDAPTDAAPPDLRDASRGIRLQKAIAAAGFASRREAESLIEAGRVSVNGGVITDLPAWVDPYEDRIEVNGRPLPRPRRRSEHVPHTAGHTYLMLNKPRRVLSTTNDDRGRATVLDLIQARIPARLYPVGRLDSESTGLILLTDDGEMTQRLTHPSYEVPKRYKVSCRGRVTPETVEKLRKGLFLADRSRQRMGKGGAPTAKRAKAVSVELLGHQRDVQRGDRTLLAMTLTEGQNREVRRLLAQLGHKVRRLERQSIGPLRLKGLAVGEWRPLTPGEVRSLRRAVKL